jgi:hypothetical protein
MEKTLEQQGSGHPRTIIMPATKWFNRDGDGARPPGDIECAAQIESVRL